MSIRAAGPADAADIAHVQVATWRSTYRGLLPDPLLANLNVKRREESWRAQAEAIGKDQRLGVLLVVEEGGKVVGFASAGPERVTESGYDAELYAIYVLEDQQGKGIGRRLVELVFAWLREQGHGSLRVWVLEGNPAEAFYQRLGGTRVGTRQEDIGGESVTEVAYGWGDPEAVPG